MYVNQYKEHLAQQPDNSRWDGFDRGTSWDDESQQETKCIGRMTSEAGYRVAIMETTCNDGAAHYEVQVNSKAVFAVWNNKDRAVRVARWWMVAQCSRVYT